MKHIRDAFSRNVQMLQGWQVQHRSAVLNAPLTYPNPSLEASMVRAIGAWCDYAIAHAAAYERQIGQDYVLGVAWARWGFALRELLNGDLGRLDGGTLDAIIHDNLAEQGFDPDMGAPS